MEVARLEWTDVDYERSKVRILPEKGSNPRIAKLSGRAMQMLNKIPRNFPTIFIGRYKNTCDLRRSFEKQRRTMAAKMGNPRLMKTHFHTLRH